MVVGVGREGEVRYDRPQVQHGGQLDPEFSRGMDGYAQLERLTDRGGLHAGSDAAPEGGIEQDDIHGGGEDVDGQLLEVDDYGVGGEGYVHGLPHAPHTVQAPGGILVVVVADVLYSPAEADALLDA